MANAILGCTLLGSSGLGTGRLLAAANCSFQGAEKFFADQQYSAAVIEMQRYLRTCPPSSLLFQRLGFAYHYAGRREEAMKALQKARELRITEVHLQIAEGSHLAGNHDVELAEAQKALTNTPNHPDALLILARGYDERGDRIYSERTYLQCARLRPKEPRAYEGIASVYLKGGDYRRAEKSLKTAAALCPDQPDVFRKLGQLYELLGKNRKAQLAFAPASRLKQQRSLA